jgi:hypothetical protein
MDVNILAQGFIVLIGLHGQERHPIVESRPPAKPGRRAARPPSRRRGSVCPIPMTPSLHLRRAAGHRGGSCGDANPSARRSLRHAGGDWFLACSSPPPYGSSKPRRPAR